MTQTFPLTEYDPAILARAPHAVRRELEDSARMDGHRRHSVVSLAVQLGVWPWLVHDVVRALEAVLREQARADLAADYPDPDEQAPDERVAEIADDADRDAWGSMRRWGGGYELPRAHPDGADYGDMYLPADTVAFVLEAIRPAEVRGEAAARGVTLR